VFGASLLLIVESWNTTVNCFSGRMSPRRRTISAPYSPLATPPVP
jgi:hypothetical protein